ncbi:MAG: disulfide reductase, partial [Thermoplasmata archaeon]|nr:disulfide reductase [Thermoplasmata archaeon]
MMVRIGVFICHCGHNIASVVDVEEVVEYAKTLPWVAHAGHNLYSCSEEGLGSIKRSITENKLDRVVVAA